MRLTPSLLTLAAALALVGCGSKATLSVDDVTGPNPKLVDPKTSWFPTVNFAKAVGWPKGAAPTPAPGRRDRRASAPEGRERRPEELDRGPGDEARRRTG
jgi:hypothetical protein